MENFHGPFLTIGWIQMEMGKTTKKKITKANRLITEVMLYAGNKEAENMIG